MPMLMLTARSRPEDVLHGFEAGADDYLPKPFELTILLARLRGLLRARANGGAEREHEQITLRRQDARFRSAGAARRRQGVSPDADGGRAAALPDEERGKAVSRKAILEDVWDLHEDTDTRAIDNFIVRLRRYMEEDQRSRSTSSTVRGVGYKFIA